MKAPGEEPIPGYVLIEPLGRGGFGEVWKCEAPGGLHKAVKFVPDDRPAGAASSLQQEFDAFQRIKAIRHPFLLALDRVEVAGGELIMVMELADQQLADRFADCQAGGLAGIPRGELLGYLADAAEVLDLFTARHGLQHLDVKPANLFLVCGRVKVGDFGLVGRVQAAATQGGLARGLTAKYTAPEVVRGQVDPRSDQYSLALVYHELLTGTFPYPAKSAQQMLLQHATAAPDLSALPAVDRPAVDKALAKDPTDRFPTCLEFVRALAAGGVDQALTDTPLAGGTPLAQWPSRLTRLVTHTPPPQPMPAARRAVGEPAPHAPAPTEVGEPRTTAPSTELARTDFPAGRYRIGTGSDLVAAVQRAACPADSPLWIGPDPQRLPTGDGWVCRFPIRRLAGLVEYKLAVLKAHWGADLDHPDGETFVLRKNPPKGVWGAPAGFEIVVRVPEVGNHPSPKAGTVEVTGKLVGPPAVTSRLAAGSDVPQLMGQVRQAIQNVGQRRKDVRVPADLPVAVYPVQVDGEPPAPVPGRCVDVSAGGLCFTAQTAPPSQHVYLAFDEWAVPVWLTRVLNDPAGGVVAAGRVVAEG